MDEGMLSFRSYLLENESQKNRTVNATIKGPESATIPLSGGRFHHLKPNHPVEVVGTMHSPHFKSAHIIKYVYDGIKHMGLILPRLLSYGSERHTAASKHEKDVMQHLTELLNSNGKYTPSNQTDQAFVHAKLLHDHIKEITKDSEITSYTAFNDSKSHAAKFKAINLDRTRKGMKPAHIEDASLLVGSDIAIHTKRSDGTIHTIYHDLKFPKTASSFSFPSPSTKSLMNKIASIQPDHAEHNNILEAIKGSTTPEEIVGHVMRRIELMGEPEKRQLYSDIFQTKKIKGNGYSVSRISISKNDDNLKVTPLGEKDTTPTGPIIPQLSGRNIHFKIPGLGKIPMIQIRSKVRGTKITA